MSSSSMPAFAHARIMSSMTNSTAVSAARSAPTSRRSATKVPTTLARGDVAFALQVDVGAVHGVVADVQVHGQRAYGGKAISGKHLPVPMR